MRLFIIGAAALVTGCVSSPIAVNSAPASCAAILPPEWEEGVAGADLPSGDSVGDWIAFGDAQTGKLDLANERTKASIGIVERCESRDSMAVKKAKGGFFKRLVG
jgi:hypothetical protein